ncbi:MAG: hypothetical protein LC745_10035, partial [Planctomycetia bacterium]|nr:hypothetical protein [Planctomycetia bacterium]
MARRRKFSRWRRLPGVYRFGDDKPADPNLEPQRLSLYLSGVALDHAAEQANRLGFGNVQEYCAELLLKAVDAERVREQVAGVEAKRGTLEGLHEIADDPEYLADLSAAAAPRDFAAPPPMRPDPRPVSLSYRMEGGGLPAVGDREAVPTRVEAGAGLDRLVALSPAALIVMRHAGQADDDPLGFLPCLRRGDPVSPAEVAELAQALHELEIEFRDTPAMDRRLTFALHRLAFESQILHTDAWPGSFDV